MRLSHIDGIKLVGNIHPAQTEVSFEDFMGDVPETFFNPLTVQWSEIENLMTTYTHLEAFTNSVKRYGMTRSLIAFADHDKALSESIPEIPSIEKLIADRSPKNSTSAVAALEVKLGTLSELIIQKIKDFFTNMTRQREVESKYLQTDLNKARTLFTIISKGERTFDSKEASEKKIKLPHYDKMIRLMDVIIKLYPLIQECVDLKLPVTIEDFNKWVLEVESKIKPVKEVCHLVLDENGKVSINDDVGLEYDYPLESLSSLGYDNIEKFHAIYDLFTKALVAHDKDITMFHKLPEEGDLRIVYRAANAIWKVADSTSYATSWIHTYSNRAMKAIFWCTDKK